MEELHQAVMRNLNKSVGHEVSDDVVWGKVMEILRQNPVNLYSFVGLITVPSNQKKVIRNSINTTMFSAKK
jgi:hypothetical protein